MYNCTITMYIYKDLYEAYMWFYISFKLKRAFRKIKSCLRNGSFIGISSANESIIQN